ncbi:MAG: carboxypeptidase-like regulatory domain-containing protein, partial [Acidobacteriaceae bacterium]
MRFVFALLCCLTALIPLSAGAQQSGGDTRTLGGVVTDMDGALVPGATVVLRTAGGNERSAVTDAGGHFRFDGVEAGAFSVKVSAVGMTGAARRGVLNADESLELPAIALKAAVSEEVEVSGLTQQE